MDFKIERLKKHDDDRGQLVVFLQQKDLEADYRKFGQIYFVTFSSRGVIRGNHYHKQWREWFGIVSGTLEVVLKDVRTGEIEKLRIDSDSHKYTRLEIGPRIAHAFRNISPYASLLNYTDKEWTPTDTFEMTILE